MAPSSNAGTHNSIKSSADHHKSILLSSVVMWPFSLWWPMSNIYWAQARCRACSQNVHSCKLTEMHGRKNLLVMTTQLFTTDWLHYSWAQQCRWLGCVSQKLHVTGFCNQASLSQPVGRGRISYKDWDFPLLIVPVSNIWISVVMGLIRVTAVFISQFAVSSPEDLFLISLIIWSLW